MRTVHYGTQVLILALVMAVRSVAAEVPQLVSPTGESSACPTFSWAVVPTASGYELVIYEVKVNGDVSPHPVTSIDLPAGASSWTLPADSCLAPGGRYAWSLRATGRVGSAWSEAVLFAVTEAPSQDEVRQALEVLRRYQRTGTSREGEVAGSTPESVIDGSIRQPIEREKDDEHLDLFESLSAPTISGAGPSPRTVETPSGFSLSIDGDFELGGFVFQGGTPFLHSDGGAAYRNTALGVNALVSATPGSPYYGSRNSAFGSRALQNNTTGYSNTASGSSALYANTTGRFNTAVGRAAMFSNTTGGSNVAIGVGTLSNNTGFKNTAIGFYAGAYTTGSGNVLINNLGWAGESNVLRIGSGTGGSAQELDKAFISGIFGRVVTDGFEVLVGSDDQLGTLTSSARFKQDIAEVGAESERLFELRPVSFRYKDEYAKGRANPIEYGLLAEEVAEVFPELVAYDEEGRPLTVRYRSLAPLLLNELRKQRQVNREHERELRDLRAILSELERGIRRGKSR